MDMFVICDNWNHTISILSEIDGKGYRHSLEKKR